MDSCCARDCPWISLSRTAILFAQLRGDMFNKKYAFLVACHSELHFSLSVDDLRDFQDQDDTISSWRDPRNATESSTVHDVLFPSLSFIPPGEGGVSLTCTAGAMLALAVCTVTKRPLEFPPSRTLPLHFKTLTWRKLRLPTCTHVGSVTWKNVDRIVSVRP